MTGISYYQLKDFKFHDGTVLPTVRLAYREFNPTAQKTALIPTCFRGRIATTTNFTNGALRDHRVIVVALLGNGESSSPSNTANFPRTLEYSDCVRAQYQLIKEHLHIPCLDVIVGFSMGGQCTYHWTAMYPEMVRNAVIICSSAKTSLHNYQFLEGPKAALVNSIDYEDGGFRTKGITPLRGLHAFGRAYSAWLTSAPWFEGRLFEKLGYQSLDEWTEGAMEGYNDWDPDDLLVMLGMWQRSDIAASVDAGMEKRSLTGVLGGLKARILLMPCLTDQYFTWEASQREASYLKDAQLAVIPSVWGHVAGGGMNPEDHEWVDLRIASFLSSEGRH